MLNILQVCYKMPAPPEDGGATVLYNHATGLLRLGHCVKVLAATTSRNFIEHDRVTPAFRTQTSLETVFIDTPIKPMRAFANLFASSSYNIDRFISSAFTKRLEALLKQQAFDLIQLETVFMAPYIGLIRKHSRAPVVLRSQNVEYKIWERLASNSRNPFKAMVL